MNLKGDYGNYGGRWPATVKSYDKASRTCRVEIQGITDGADNLPSAEIEYPIGDKSRSGKYETEIEILPDDTVWVAFINGDYRYPIITGYRNPSVNNSIDWRRWHHANVETLGDALVNHKAGTDHRIEAGNDLQHQCGKDALIRAGQHFKANATGYAQVVANEQVLIRSIASRIILKSAGGVLVI